MILLSVISLSTFSAEDVLSLFCSFGVKFLTLSMSRLFFSSCLSSTRSLFSCRFFSFSSYFACFFASLFCLFCSFMAAFVSLLPALPQALPLLLHSFMRLHFLLFLVNKLLDSRLVKAVKTRYLFFISTPLFLIVYLLLTINV